MGPHIQIEVYDDRICFWNDGLLPEDLTIEMLKKKHSSKPRNSIIADVCFKGGYIDAWGRGIEKILAKGKAPLKISRELVNSAYKKDGRDDATAAVIKASNKPGQKRAC